MSFNNVDGEENTVYVELSGTSPDEWNRVGESLIGLIEKLSNKIGEVSGGDISSGADVAKNISTIATRWAKAKIERPSLENDSLKADILKKLAEADKTRSEANQIDSEIKHKEVLVTLEAMERLIEIQQKMSRLGIEMHKHYPKSTHPEIEVSTNKKIQPTADSGG